MLFGAEMCPEHKRYRGIYKPRTDCAYCRAIWEKINPDKVKVRHACPNCGQTIQYEKHGPEDCIKNLQEGWSEVLEENKNIKLQLQQLQQAEKQLDQAANNAWLKERELRNQISQLEGELDDHKACSENCPVLERMCRIATAIEFELLAKTREVCSKAFEEVSDDGSQPTQVE